MTKQQQVVLEPSHPKFDTSLGVDPSIKNKSVETAKSKSSFIKRHQTMINFWLDLMLLVNFLLLAWVAVIVQFVFPPAGNAQGYLLWGFSLSRWMDIQFGLLVIFFFGIVLHLMLHWPWICGVLATRILQKNREKKHAMDDGQRTILGVGLLIVVLNIMGLGIAAAVLAIQSPW